MPESSQPTVLLIGECQSPQFQKVLSNGQTSDILHSTQNHRANSLSEAISLIGNGELVPNLVVAYQSIPDEYSAAEIDQLIGMLPLSQFVVAFSPWCESIGRTEQRWPFAWSVPVAHAGARIRYELQQLMTDVAPLPATASRDEAFRTLAAGCLEGADSVGLGMSAKVISADVPIKECFEQILTAVGFDLGDDELPDVYVVAAAFIDEDQLRHVKAVYDEDAWARGFATKSSEAVILVASEMATPGDSKRLLESGATAVISQLRFVEDLVGYFRSRTISKSSAAH